VISFAYESEWTAARDGFQLDPSLPLFEGEQYAASLPGIFADAAPDRWGRTLLERREAYLADREERRQRQLVDWDFLLGVDDLTRMGALRIAPAAGGAFLSGEALPVPPVGEVRRAVGHWREVAAEARLPTEEVERFAGAFPSP